MGALIPAKCGEACVSGNSPQVRTLATRKLGLVYIQLKPKHSFFFYKKILYSPVKRLVKEPSEATETEARNGRAGTMCSRKKGLQILYSLGKRDRERKSVSSWRKRKKKKKRRESAAEDPDSAVCSLLHHRKSQKRKSLPGELRFRSISSHLSTET